MMPEQPIEFDTGTDGDRIMRPDSSLEDVVWAHRYAVPLISIASLMLRSRDFVGKPIADIPHDFLRLAMRHHGNQDLVSMLHHVALMPSLPTSRKWY